MEENDSPFQETTSTYFNSIVRADVRPLTVDDLHDDVIEEFNSKVRLAFTDEGESVVHRVRYLIPYILQSIDWNEYGIPLDAWQLQYYYRRERFIRKSHLSYDDFLRHEPLQGSIAALGLEAEPTFEFFLFLKYYFGMRSELRHSAIEQLEELQAALSEMNPDEEVTLDVKVGRKHFTIRNKQFVKEAMLSIDKGKLRRGVFTDDFNEGSSREKLRAIDYYIVKTLLDFLPIKHTNEKRGQFSQQERNFGLSVLSFCGRLPDVDREGECSSENNATFDKLMRDFQGVRIPFAMELFL